MDLHIEDSFKEAGFTFDDDFNERDHGLQTTGCKYLDEAELLNMIRANPRDQRNLEKYPFAFEYFDTCKSKISTGYIETLERIVNNVEKLKKMDAQIKNGDSSHYNVPMPFIIAFGNHPILENAAKECTEQLKVKFQEFSKTCQKDILASRRAAVEKLLESLTNYKQECLKIGQTAWLEQCRKVSRKNIYDGQYAVKVTVKKPATMEDIEEDRSFEARISTILFIAALEDAKDLITAQILKRRNEQQTRAAEDRALRDKQREVDERASHSDSTKLLLEELGNMRGQMNKCLSVLEEYRDLGSRVAALEGRQHNNNTPTKARADSAHSYSSPKNENGGAPGGNNWSKTPRKSRTDDAPASARGVTTPSATRAGWGNQQTPLRSGSPHHTSRGCREGGDVERVVVRIPESRPAETMDRERRTNFAPRYGKNGNGRDRGHGLDKE